MAIKLAERKATLQQQISSNSTRSNRYNVDGHLQGTEITDINLSRAALPVVGRNQRYKIVDQEIGIRASIFVKLPTPVTPSQNISIGAGTGNDSLIPAAGDEIRVTTGDNTYRITFHTSGSWPTTFASTSKLGALAGYANPKNTVELRINNSIASGDSCLEIANLIRNAFNSITTTPVLHSGSLVVMEGYTVGSVIGSAGARLFTITAPNNADYHDFFTAKTDTSNRITLPAPTQAVPKQPTLSGSSNISYGSWVAIQHINSQASSESNIVERARGLDANGQPVAANPSFNLDADVPYQKYPYVGLPVRPFKTGSLVTSTTGSQWNTINDFINFVNLNNNLIATRVPDAAGGSMVKIEMQQYGDIRYSVFASGSIGLFNTADSSGFNPSSAGGKNLKANNFSGGVQVGQGNLSRNHYFTDIGTILDAGLGQDIISGNQFDPLATGKPQLPQQSSTPSVANVKFPNSRYVQIINFEMQNDDYGFQKEYFDTTPFFDLSKFDPIEFINLVDPTGMFPVVGSFPNYDSSLQLNGIVEPLEIRRRMLGYHLFLDSDRQPGAVSGDTNAQEFVVNSRDVAEIKAAEMAGINFGPARADYFEDVAARGFYISGSLTAEGLALSMLEPEYIADFTKGLPPYVDRSTTDLLPYDDVMSNAIMDMDPTVDEGLLPEGFIDYSTGFTSHARDNHNSMNYRGMFRR